MNIQELRRAKATLNRLEDVRKAKEGLNRLLHDTVEVRLTTIETRYSLLAAPSVSVDGDEVLTWLDYLEAKWTARLKDLGVDL